jgi:hypothetical protein|tara:strand:+ start:866 stop:1099 length:234 start_codon:yes stop_codon:yes gene_type:complete
MLELLTITLLFSIAVNVVQALNTEYSKGYNLGMKYANDWDKRVKVMEERMHKMVENQCCNNDQIELMNQKVNKFGKL